MVNLVLTVLRCPDAPDCTLLEPGSEDVPGWDNLQPKEC
jgi:hypothetical protein